jgi:hypothetical protein
MSQISKFPPPVFPMSLAALRFNRLFRCAAWLALWAMLLPAVLPLAHHSAASAGGAHRICHVALGGDHRQAPDQGKVQPTCPICQSLGSLAQGFVPPDVVALAVFHPLPVSVEDVHQSFAVFDVSTAAWPRAPPVLA